MGPEIVVPIAFLISVPVTVIGIMLARAHGRRLERGAYVAQLPAELSERLERMEQAMDAMAVEIERISEGQRFTTRLLSEKASAPGVQAPGVQPQALQAPRQEERR